jgi:hypothetical protein
LEAQGRLLTRDWDLYDTRHATFQPARMSAAALEAGYWHAYREFYRWGSILQAAGTKRRLLDRARHLAYAGGWKKLEPLWDIVIRARAVHAFLPLLEAVLCGGRGADAADRRAARRSATRREGPLAERSII